MWALERRANKRWQRTLVTQLTHDEILISLINFENKRNALLISSDNDVHDYYFTSNDFHFEQDLEQKRFPFETIGEI